ncbi:MAG: hypothetical protein A3F12_02300 [Gammaproteobacteria bacterium RIFCSPHIGHO2_12_FULL_38_14]|nr:MAG: hypothetical protein A3F12_02300 [Gammaproteobacteria bacterium RIFCSPHIGHO2_12_FULL_38_14]
MIKHAIALIAISIAVILSMPYAQEGMQFLLMGHDWISQVLTDVFTGGEAGNFARELLTLLSIPLIAGLIPALIYWAVKKHFFPYFMNIVWIVWLLQAGALLIYKTVM